MPFQYQKELRERSRGKVIRALMRGRMSYTDLRDETRLSDRTLTNVLKELEADRTVYSVNAERKRWHYVLNESVSNYIKRENLYVFEKLDEMRRRYDLLADEKGRPSRTVNGVSFVPSLDTFFPIVSSSTLMEGELTDDANVPSENYFPDVGLLSDEFALYSYQLALDKAFTEMNIRTSKYAPKDGHGTPIINIGDDDLVKKLCNFEGMSVTSVMIDYKALGNAIEDSMWFYRMILGGHSISEIYPYNQVSADPFSEDPYFTAEITQKDIDQKRLPEKPGRESVEEIIFGYFIPRQLITIRNFLKHFRNHSYKKEFDEFIFKVQRSVDGKYKEFLNSFKEQHSEVIAELKSLLYFRKEIPLDLMLKRFGPAHAKPMLALFTGVLLAIADVSIPTGAKVFDNALNSYGDWMYGAWHE